MPLKEMFKGKRLNIYAIFLAIVLFIIALAPLFFYQFGHMKNPREFMIPEKKYLAIEFKAFNIPPEYLSAIEIGDSERDNNGEEIVEIISVEKVEPKILGRFASGDNKYTEILGANSDIIFLLKVRYNEIMGRMMPYSTTDVELKAGNFFSFKTSKNMLLSGRIMKVDTYK